MSSKLSYEIVGDANVKDIAPAKRNIGEKAQQEKVLDIPMAFPLHSQNRLHALDDEVPLLSAA